MTTTTVIVKYAIADSVATVGQSIFKERAKFDGISNWKFIDKLNKPKIFEFSVPNDEFGRYNALIEREAFVPFLRPFHGIVSARNKTESEIQMTVSEKAYHLTRRIFRVDGEEEVTYTDTDWISTSWSHRRAIIVNPDDVPVDVTAITLRINVTDLGFKAHAKSDGFDFRVTKKDGITTVTYERIAWNPATGALNLYFTAGDISSSGITKFYIYYGNAAASDGSTAITEADPNIPLFLAPQEQYKLAVNIVAQQILTSANTDMPVGVTWTLGEDIPTTLLIGTFKWKTHYDALQGIAELIGKDVWFDNKLHRVFIGIKGKDLTEELDIIIQAHPSVTTGNFANIINVLGKKDSVTGMNLEGSSSTPTLLKYNYEKVVSDNQLRLPNEVNNIASNLLAEFQKLTPQVKGEIPYNQFVRLNLESGDRVKLGQSNKELNDTYR